MIVEVGDDTLSERLESIQSELGDTGEASSSRMVSSRSLSEWSGSEADEPSAKRLRTEVSFIDDGFFHE